MTPGARIGGFAHKPVYRWALRLPGSTRAPVFSTYVGRRKTNDYQLKFCINKIITRRIMLQEAPSVITDDKGSDCPCIHWVAATIIQKRCRGWLVFISYQEFQQCRKEIVPRCHRIFMAKIRIALWPQGR
jgi:hypothetical protein